MEQPAPPLPEQAHDGARLTIILPFYNEEGWIGQTMASLAEQTDTRFRIILVDNASTDAGSAEALAAGRSISDRLTIISCPTPGKTNAMQCGLAAVQTPLVAICDADTHYPPDYVHQIITLFDGDAGAAAVMAINLYAPVDAAASRRRIAFILRKNRRFRAKCHAGGYAQSFRTEILRKVGGFDVKIWPYLMEDHEIIHRVHRHGHSLYRANHVCFPSDRRTSRDRVSWTRFERLLYRYMPQQGMNWFFYDFLAARFAARKTLAAALREKTWDQPETAP